jgi:hypothetical protein
MKKFSEFLNEYQIGDNPTVRDPASRDFLNKHLVMKYKLSVPTEDENLFNAANISPGQAHRPSDNSTPDDHSIGYSRPVMFGDYLNYLLKMRSESVEHDAIVSELEDLDEEALDDVIATELPEVTEAELNELADFINTYDIIVEEIEYIEELDRQGGSILNRYIDKTHPDYKSPAEIKKRKAGRELALKKKWGDKAYGFDEPKVKAVHREEVELEEGDTHHYQGHATYIKRGGPSEKNPGTVSIAASKTVEHNVPFKASHSGSRPTNDKIMRSVKDHPRHKELEADGWKLHKWTPKPGFDTRKKIGEETVEESSHKKSDYIGVKGSTLSLLGRKKPVEKKKKPLDAPWPAKGSIMSMHGRKKDGSFKEETELQEGMPSSVIKHKQKLAALSDKEFAQKHQDKSEDDLRAMARRHGYGSGTEHYINRRKNGLHEAEDLDEGNVWKSTDGEFFGKNSSGATRKFKSRNEALSFAKEDVELAEAKRGRPPKNKPAEDGEEQEHQPILVQLRKHEISRGQTKIKFHDGSEHHVDPKHVKKALDKHVHLRTSIEKGDYQAALAHSHLRCTSVPMETTNYTYRQL